MITFGFSKDHRPDLKQLVHSLLCVDAGIPIFSQCENGNLSDKVANRNLIPTMVERLAREIEKIEYACLPDAQAAVSRLPKGRFHALVGQMEEEPIHTTGRPKAVYTRSPS